MAAICQCIAENYWVAVVKHLMKIARSIKCPFARERERAKARENAAKHEMLDINMRAI